MFKASLKLPKIHKNLALSFNLIIDSEVGAGNNQNSQTVREFDYEGNHYITISGHPYITIDISTSEDRKSGWSTYRMVNLNQKNLFDFTKALKEMIHNFKAIQDLYFIDRMGKLTLNRVIATKIRKDIITPQKIIRLEPCLVPDEKNEEVFYEGCLMYISKVDYYTYLSFNEMEFLYYVLSNIDMNSLMLQLLTTIRIYNKGFEKAVQDISPGETKEVGNPDDQVFISMEKETIPEI